MSPALIDNRDRPSTAPAGHWIQDTRVVRGTMFLARWIVQWKLKPKDLVKLLSLACSPEGLI